MRPISNECGGGTRSVKGTLVAGCKESLQVMHRLGEASEPGL